MGFLSSLFGGGPKTTVVQSRIPEELAPYVKQILGEQQALYETRLGETPEEFQYQGQTIADLSEAQQEARKGIRGLVSAPKTFPFPIEFEGDKPIVQNPIVQRPLEPGELETLLSEPETVPLPRPVPLPEPVLVPEPGRTRLPRDYRGRSQDAFRRAYEGLVGVGEKFTDDQVGFEGTPTQFTGTQFEEKPLEEYMSPFQRAVTDVQKRKASEDFFEKVLPQLRSGQRGRGRGSALGSRGAIVEAQLRDKFGRQLGDIEAIGLEKAYQDAQRRKAEDFERFKDQRGFEERGRKFLQSERDIRSDLFERQKKREAQVAEGLAGFAPREFQQRLKEFGALERIGAEDQALEQKALNRAYADYLERRERPETLLARYTSGVYGNPMLRVPSKTETKPGVGLGQQLLGFGTALLGAPSGSIFGSMLGMGSTGGGIGSLVNRRMGGGLSSLNPTVINPMGEIVRRFRGGPTEAARQQQELLESLGKGKKLFSLGLSKEEQEAQQEDDFLSASPKSLAKIYRDTKSVDEAKKQGVDVTSKPDESSESTFTKLSSIVLPKSAQAQNLPQKGRITAVQGSQKSGSSQPNVSDPIIAPNLISGALNLTGVDPDAPIKSADMSTIKTILTDTQKRNEEIEKQAKDLLSTKTPDAVKARFGEIKTQTDKVFTDLQKTQDKNLQTFLSKIKKLNTPTDLPGMLFYIGVAGASDPDGFFSGATKGLKKWSDANIKDKKERKQFERDLAKYEFQASKDILNTVKEGKLAGLNLSKEQQEAISKLPKEKLAILQILSQSQAGVDKVRLEIAKLGAEKEFLDMGTGNTVADLKESLVNLPAIKKAMKARYGKTQLSDPRFKRPLDELVTQIQRATAQTAKKMGRKKVMGGDTKRLEREIISKLENNQEFINKLMDSLEKYR